MCFCFWRSDSDDLLTAECLPIIKYVLYCVFSWQNSCMEQYENLGSWLCKCVCLCVCGFASIGSHQKWKPRVTSGVNLFKEQNCIVLLLLFHVYTKYIVTNSCFNFITISATSVFIGNLHKHWNYAKTELNCFRWETIWFCIMGTFIHFADDASLFYLVQLWMQDFRLSEWFEYFHPWLHFKQGWRLKAELMHCRYTDIIVIDIQSRAAINYYFYNWLTY